MAVLHEDRERGMSREIQRLQDFEIVAFRIDMKQVHVSHSVSSEDFRQGAYVDICIRR